MKKLLVLIVMALISFTLIACNNDESGGKITIDFWHMSPVGSESYSGMRSIITEFNESQDTYFVKGTGFSFWDYWDKINVAVSSRTAPDVGLSTIDDVQARARQNVLYNISELIENDDSDVNLIDLDEFRASQLEFATYNDSLFAMPFSATTRALFYNIDMFESVGLTEADVPKTWSELETISKMFDVVEGNQIQRLGFDPTYGNATYHGWLWQKGLDFFDEDLMPTLNTQGHRDVLQWIIDFNGSDYTRNQLTAFGEGNQMLGINPFAAERVAMIVEVDGLYQVIKNSAADFNYGVAPIPIPDEDGIHVNWGSGFSIELYDNGKNEEDEKLGAYEFLKYLLSKDTQKELAEVNGWIMSHITAMEEFAADKPIMQKLLLEVDDAIDKMFVPYAPGWHGNDWQPFYTQALDGDLTVSQALEAARQNYLQKKENWERTN